MGAQFGQPTGFSLKIYQPGRMSPDLLLAWDLDDFLFVNVHGIYEKPIAGARNFEFFLGPGFFIGLRNRNRNNPFFRDNDFAAGISGTFGLSLLFDRLEIFLQLTPRLEIIDATNGSIGGGLGLRFYL